MASIAISYKSQRTSIDAVEASGATANDHDNPFSHSLKEFTRDLNINTTSVFVAAQQAVLGFEQLPDAVPKTFIYTGNILNTTTMPSLLDLGVGKSATAHIIQSAAEAYKDRGFRYEILVLSHRVVRLTCVDFITLTNGKPTDPLHTLTLMERRTGSYTYSWQGKGLRVLGNKLLSKVWDTSNSEISVI